MSKKFYQFCNSSINVIFGILSLFIFIANVMAIFGGNIIRSIIEIALCAAFMICFFVFVNKKYDFLKHIAKRINSASKTKLIICIVAISLSSKFVLLALFQTDSSVHPDIGMYWSFIKELSSSGRIVENAEYAVRYPYTVMYATFYLPFAKIVGSDNILLYDAYLIILFTIAAVLLFDLIDYYKNRCLSYVAVLLWLLSPVGLTSPLALIHENGFLVLHIVAIWILFRLQFTVKNVFAKVCCVIIAGLIIAYATSFNKFGLISVVAISILLILNLFKDRWNWKRFAVALLIPVYLVSMIYAASIIRNEFVERVVDKTNVTFDSSYRFPYGWGLYLGAGYENYGTWNEEDFNRYEKFREYENKDDAINYQKDLIIERYKEYLVKPYKVIVQLLKKNEEIWGRQYSPIFYTAYNSASFYELFFYGLSVSTILFVIFQMILLITSCMQLFSFQKTKEGRKCLLQYFKMFLIGATIVLLPFEVTYKYSAMFWIMFYAILGMQIPDLMRNVKCIGEKIENGKKIHD